MTRNDTAYQHTQRAPIYWLLYALSFTLLGLGGVLRTVPPIFWAFFLSGLLMLIVAAAFHHLTVRDRGDSLSVAFGPISLFRRDIDYRDVLSVEVGRTTTLDGWGIHLSLKGGWVWNIWGRDCVMVRLKNGGVLRIGTDDAENLAQFLTKRCGKKQ
ncbi:MAG TPA: hypothetical protein VG326_17345 [Tepidisphaeraceae bacterium]|nr:hypothetical protein [Tepidisphaeraceae bacterium]